MLVCLKWIMVALADVFAELSHSIVNTDCIQRANGFSEASAEFLDAVKKLYSACPFTRHTAKFCEATHAFPYARGSDVGTIGYRSDVPLFTI